MRLATITSIVIRAQSVAAWSMGIECLRTGKSSCTTGIASSLASVSRLCDLNFLDPLEYKFIAPKEQLIDESSRDSLPDLKIKLVTDQPLQYATMDHLRQSQPAQ